MDNQKPKLQAICKTRTQDPDPGPEDPCTTAQLVEDYADVFKGLGCLEGDYTIKIDESVAPVVHPPRRAPFAMKDRLKTELDRMESIGAITNVTEPTE